MIARGALVLILLLAADTARADDGFAACAARYNETGLPQMKADQSGGVPIALCRAGYAAAFDPETRTPDWVIERLTLDQLKGDAHRSGFHADKGIDGIIEGKGPQNADYARSGFDKGHQAPAGDFKSSQKMMNESFLLTNMAPQVGAGFNRTIWKVLETDIRDWVLCGGRPELIVVTGPVYGSEEKWIPKGTTRVRVPEAFFKVIYDPRNKRALGMLLPNRKLDTGDLPDYAVAISLIEEKTGIVFFPAMTRRQQNVLKTSAGNLWGVGGECVGGGE